MPSVLEVSVYSYLAELDSILAEAGMPLARRPLQSALAYVVDVVEKVSSGTLEHPIGQPWFDAIHYEALRWYHERYGDALRADVDGSALGIVVLGGAPIRLSFPLTVARPGTEPLTIRLSFPDALRDDEDPETFIDGNIGFDTLQSDQRQNLRVDAATLIARIRQINRDLRFADLPPAVLGLVNRAMWSLRHAADSIAANSPDRLGLAVWELNLTAELAHKIFLRQRGIESPKSHSVPRLHKLANDHGLPEIDDAELEIFPTESTVTRHRYGEEAPPTFTDIMRFYDRAVLLAAHCALNLKRGIWIAPDGWIEVRTIGSLARGA